MFATVRIAILLVLFFALTMIAAPSARAVDMASGTDPFELPISRGRWKVGGYVSAFKDDDGNSLTFAPEAEYFLIDRLSLGFEVNGTWTSYGFSRFDAGPAATFYFGTDDHWAYYARQTISYSKSNYNPELQTAGTTGLGATYFFNKYVGLSPEIRASYGKDRLGIAIAYCSFNVFF
ncbi:MAG: hypothetical protein AAB250_10545 [Bdellovibrionota bacterium]